MIDRIQQQKTRLNQIGPGFCLAKFYDVSMHLETGRDHSCVHPRARQVPVEEIQASYHALHNSQGKKDVRQQMLEGQRPSECGYCWRMEDAGPDILSDRSWYSARWNDEFFNKILNNGANHNYFPTHLEISFSIICNFKCVYCGPQVSSQWLKDLKNNGPYGHKIWSIEAMTADGEMPIDDEDSNPYIKAFWEWLPEAYPHLRTLRVTGGEPLLSPNTYRVLNWAIENKNLNLEIGINTNLGVPDLLIDRLTDRLKQLIRARTVRSVKVYTSGEGCGSQFEYMRMGSDYSQWKRNIIKILDASPEISVEIMTTYNALSVQGYMNFLVDINQIQKTYGHRLHVDTHMHLQFPRHLSIDILTADFLEPVQQQIEFLKQTQNTLGVHRADRLLKYFKSALDNPSESLQVQRHTFYNFILEYDARSGTNFYQTFPDMQEFFETCRP